MQIGEDERREGVISLLMLSCLHLHLSSYSSSSRFFFQLALRALLNFLSHGNELKR